MSSIPEIIFGGCPRCGGAGGDEPNPNLGTDAPPRDLVGNGYPLEFFQGELMCELCKKEFLADEESLVDAELNAEDEFFRAKAGFRKTIT